MTRLCCPKAPASWDLLFSYLGTNSPSPGTSLIMESVNYSTVLHYPLNKTKPFDTARGPSFLFVCSYSLLSATITLKKRFTSIFVYSVVGYYLGRVMPAVRWSISTRFAHWDCETCKQDARIFTDLQKMLLFFIGKEKQNQKNTRDIRDPGINSCAKTEIPARLKSSRVTHTDPK